MNERDSLSSSRRAFLGRTALGGGALALGALVLPTLPARALDFSYGDGRLLEFLLEVQALQTEYFTTAAITPMSEGLSLGENNLINTLAEQDDQQKRWCKGALRKFAMGQGGVPSTMSGGFHSKRYTFPIMKTRETMLRDSLRLKTISVSVWTGAVGRADKGEIASALASLAGVQSRHRAMLAHALDEPAIMAMAPTMSLREATSELERYGFSAAM